MKFSKTMLTFLALASLVGCTSKGGGGKPTPTPPGPGPSGKEWNAEAKALMMQEVNEVLPYATGIKDNYTVQNEDGYPPMIYDDSQYLTIENYYQALAQAGWTVDMNGDSIFYENEYGEEQCFNYKKDASESSLVYCVYYYLYLDDYGYPDGNTIQFDSWELSNTKTTDTSWGDKFVDTYFEDLIPFVQLGSDYEVQFSEDGMEFVVADSYYQSLFGTYDQALEGDGFAYNAEEGCYEKTYDADGNKLQISFGNNGFTGNKLYGVISLAENTSTTWPSAVVDPVVTGSGLGFEAITGSGYSFIYTKFGDNVSVYVEGADEDTAWDAYTSVYSGGDEGIVADFNSLYYLFLGVIDARFENWAETRAIEIYFVPDSDYDDSFYAPSRAEEAAETGALMISFLESKPHSTYVDSFPADVVDDAFDVTPPSIAGEFKYEVIYAEEESEDDYDYDFDDDYLYARADETPAVEYVYVYAKDAGTVGVDSKEDAYLAALKAASWYIDESEYESSGIAAEDAEGKLGITFFTEYKTFSVSFEEGSGTTHTKGVKLPQTSVNIAQGGTYAIKPEFTMIYDYDIAFVSDNENIVVDSEGVVSVESTVPEETTGKITVTVTDHSDSHEYTLELNVKVKNTPIFQKVTSASDIVVGKEYTFVYESDTKTYAAGELNKYLAPVEVTLSGSTFEDSESITKFTLGGSSSTGYTFSNEDGYLNMDSTSNNKLSYKTAAENNSYWDITFSSTGVKVSNHAETDWSIQWNSSASRFSNYSSKQVAICLYYIA